MAQNNQYKPFRVDISAGAGLPTSNRVGYVLSIEPKYAIDDQISIGLRTEALVIYQKPFDNTISTVGTLSVRSYSVTGDRYVNLAGKKRFSAGVAIGIYQYARGIAERDSYKPISHGDFSVIQPGFAPRVGFDISHLRLGIEYNLVLYQREPNINYFSAKIGVLIGGGKQQN